MENNRPLNNNPPGDNTKPPPYEDLIDEFEADKKTTNTSVALKESPYPSTALQQTQTNPIKSAASFTNEKQNDGSYQTDFFQKPPKFLLYPSASAPEDGSTENNEKEFGMSPLNRPTATANNQPKIPTQALPMFAATAQPINQHQSNPANGGIAMSVPQLDHQANVPMQHCFVTDNYLPRHSFRMVCPNCKASVNSVVQYVSGQLTHLVALVACWFTCCLACVPYFIDDLKDAEHFCPQCRSILGYNRKKVF